ncbi:hypothetical protein VP01_8977g1, partial [Puccinia sorghi]
YHKECEFGDSQHVIFSGPQKIHHVGEVADICARHHVLVLFLPPYTPDFNRIKKEKSFLKQKLQQHNKQLPKEFSACLITWQSWHSSQNSTEIE